MPKNIDLGIPIGRFAIMGLRKASVWLSVLGRFMVPIAVLGALFLALVCLEQGTDAVRMSHERHLEHPPVRFIGHPQVFWSELSVLFMAVTLWYFSRLIAYANDDALQLVPRLRQHLPRFIGFSCFNMLLLARWRAGMFEDPSDGMAPIGAQAAAGLFIVGGAAQYALYRVLVRRLGRHIERWHWSLRAVRTIAMMMVFGALIAMGAWAGDPIGRPVGLLAHLIIQYVFMAYVTLRSRWFLRLPRDTEALVPEAQGGRGARALAFVLNGARNMVMPILNLVNRAFERPMREFNKVNGPLVEMLHKKARGRGAEPVELRALIEHDVGFVAVFTIFLLFLLWIFIHASFDPGLAVRAGTVTMATLGLTLLAAVFSVITLIRRLYGVSLFAILLVVAVINGRFADPHDIHTVARPLADKRSFADRITLRAYCERWYSERKEEIRACPYDYPMFFVLADGGASRSGYWVASVLGALHDSTGTGVDGFGRHLFCMSGASGGSVGIGTSFALLYQARSGSNIGSMRDQGRAILKSDLLSPTVAAMLGADAINLAFPSAGLPDRARALERALDLADDGTCCDGAFQLRLSALVTGPSAPRAAAGMPLLFINSTRVQDGRPAVISTIDISEPFYNGRVDVLDLLPEDRDMELGTAMIMSARFPYVSPAGRINSEEHKEHHFVDGGYFDNSGAGITHEVIAQLFSSGKLLDTVVTVADSAIRRKIVPYVIHIGNSKLVESDAKPISPIANDLASPLMTLLGAYGMQTDVNDLRLKTMLQRILKNKTLYLDIQLYRDGAELESYPMSWAMSGAVIGRIDERLRTHEDLQDLIAYINSGYDPRYRPGDIRLP